MENYTVGERLERLSKISENFLEKEDIIEKKLIKELEGIKEYLYEYFKEFNTYRLRADRKFWFCINDVIQPNDYKEHHFKIYMSNKDRGIYLCLENYKQSMHSIEFMIYEDGITGELFPEYHGIYTYNNYETIQTCKYFIDNVFTDETKEKILDRYLELVNDLEQEEF